MVTWKSLTADEASLGWDEELFQFADYTHSQTYGWGRYRSAFGWQPCYWKALDGQGNTVAMLQGLLRVYPGRTGLLWAAGGPVGDLSVCDDALMKEMVRSTGVRRLYCRINSTRPNNPDDAQLLGSQGWRRTKSPLLSGLSMIYDPSVDGEARRAACTKNWRHNLRRSEKYGLNYSQWKNPDIGKISEIYGSMQDYKQLAEQFSRQEFESIFRELGSNIILYKCDDESGEAVSLRGCVIFGTRAWDMFAATSVKGRKMYASYGLFWQLMQHCHDAGVSHYDMSGIDPEKNRGVYDFKKGTGASPLEYLGEWEWASSGLLRWAASQAIRRKAGGL